MVVTRLEAVERELRVAKAALSALSGKPDAASVAEHANAISIRLGWVARLVGRLDGER